MTSSSPPIPAPSSAQASAPRGSRWLLLGLVVLAQIVALAAILADRVLLLRNGREVTLDLVPVDPRSLFRGDYARLDYAVARIPAALTASMPPRHAGAIFVTLAREADAAWKPIALSPQMPSATSAEQVVLRARPAAYQTVIPGRPLTVRYGIEAFFVPEGTGLALEAKARTGTMKALIAVGRGGEAAIKGLVIDGRTVYEERLF